MFAACSALVFAAACSSSTSGSGASGPTTDQACADSAAARCQRIATCSAVRIQELYGDEATCEARVKANCVSALGAPSNANTPANVASCTAAVPSWACGDILTGANPPAACAQVMGPLANAAACYAAGQCQSGFCGFSSSACGACTPPPGVGQPATSAGQCSPGLVRASADGTCVAPVALGGKCDGKTAICAPSTLCVMSTCTAIDSTTPPGQPCGNVGGKTVACAGGNCIMGTCVAHATDGAACDLTGGPYCEPPALCVGGTCQTAMCH
jgi:hypothetical protein